MEHGDIEHLDFVYAVTKTLNSVGIKPIFRSIDQAALGILEGENLDFELLEQTVVDPLRQMIAAVIASQLSIIRIDVDTSPDAAMTLGVALAKNRPAILAHSSKASIPSNLAGLNHIAFASFSELATKLNRVMKHFLNHSRENAK